MKIITRKEYMDNLTGKDEDARGAIFRAYYAQFVTPRAVVAVKQCIGLERLKSSTDKHLNDIPLELWDKLSYAAFSSPNIGLAGEWKTPATAVCILKEAARQIVEGKWDDTN